MTAAVESVATTPPVHEVGFGVAPSFFKSNASLVEPSPAKIAERRAVDIRVQAFNDAVRFHREAIDALFRLRAFDATGQLVAGIEHFEVHNNRADVATDQFLDTAEGFAKEWKL